MRLNYIKQTIALLLIASCAAGATPAAEEYCNGYREGFKAGYEQATNYGTPPRITICPKERHKDSSDRRPDYQRGYDVGVKDGIRQGTRG